MLQISEGEKHSRGSDDMCKGPGAGECLTGGRMQVGHPGWSCESWGQVGDAVREVGREVVGGIEPQREFWLSL